METLFIRRTNLSTSILWVILFLMECLLACVVIIYPYYAIPFFIIILAVSALFFYPELSFYLFLLTLICHLFEFLISSVHSIPPRIWRIDNVPVDMVALRSLLTNILVIIAAISWVFSRMAKARPPYPGTALDLPAIAFFIWFVITLFWTADWRVGVVIVFALFCCYLGFFLSVAVIRTKKILNIAVGILIFVGLINSGVVVYSLYGEPIWKELFRSENISIYFSFINMAKTRGMGFIYSPMTAYFLNITILLSIAMFLVTNNLKKRLLLALIIFFMIYAHLATISKGPIVGLLAGLSFMAVTCKQLRRHLFLFGVVIVTVLILSIILVYMSWPWPEKAQFFQPRQSMGPRYVIWSIGFEEFILTHGFGFGCGAFYPAHNIFLQILYELGIPGLMFWLWLLFKLFYSVREVLLKQSIEPYYRTMILGFSAGMIAILIVSLADNYYFEETMWAFLGIGMAMVNLANKTLMQAHKEAKVYIGST